MTRDKKIEKFLKKNRECRIYFQILEMRLFEKTDCPLNPEEVEEQDARTLINLYIHLEEYEKCHVLHAAKLAT